jgi:hypothetical protein
MSSDVKQVEKTLLALRSKRDALVAHGVELGEQRQHVAYGAHTGDAGARKKLDTINREAVLHDSELRSLNAAIAEAAERVKQAQAVEAQAAHREIAAELLARAHAVAVHAAELDAANVERVRAARAISEELQTMRQIAHGLGVFVPNEQQFLSLGERAERTTLMEMPFHRIAERLAPNERRTHSSYSIPWSETIAKGVAGLLGDKQEEAA